MGGIKRLVGSEYNTLMLLSRITFACCILPAFIVVAQSQTSPGAPEGLMVNLLRRPELTVITDRSPRFSWIVNDPARGAVQSAYEIMVSMPSASSDTLWDSQKRQSADSTAVSYEGVPLRPNTTYLWRVRTWSGQDRISPWSKWQRFNIGDLYAKRDWPGESRWVELSSQDGIKRWVPENREPLDYHAIAPASVRKTGDGGYFFEFGRAAFATLRITVTSLEEGKQLRVRLGEKRSGDAVDSKPGGSIYFGQHVLTLKKGKHTYDLALPRHVSKMPHSLVLPEQMPEVEPFRYAQIIGCPCELSADDVRQLALFYYFDDDASSFISSDADLNSVWDLSKYTLKATPFMGLYIDGVRERMPYEADALIQSLGQYCVDREYAIARCSAEFLYYHATWPTEWVMQSVLLAYADYMNTADTASLTRNYDTLKAKTLMALEREDGLISTRTGKMTPAVLASIHFNGKELRDNVDWPQNTETDGYQYADYNTVVNAFHYRPLVLMAAIAEATDHTSDATMFRHRADDVRRAFNKAFFDSARGVYVDGEGVNHASLHANAFPLALGLIPNERVPKIVKFLKSRGMACGPYGAQFLLEGLYDANAADIALSLLTNKTDRGWLNMIRSGSTMTMEAWDMKYKKNLTWNHAWGTAPANLIPRKLMGVEPLEPGFVRMRIRPQPGPLTFASLKLPTIRGTVLVAYHRNDQTVRLDITIPANTRAQVHIPTGHPESIRESGVVPEEHAGIRLLSTATYEIPAGTYQFTTSAGR